MKILKYPDKEKWESILRRPVQDNSVLDSSVREILSFVKDKGNEAIRYYNSKFDGYKSSNLLVSEKEIDEADKLVNCELKEAIRAATQHIESFHSSQEEAPEVIETTGGVSCWRENRAIEKVGLYIPGGTAPLFSSVLMLAIPARIAGCEEIIMCTPPGSEGKINPAILFAASLCGVTKIFKTGGAQAIAAMAYGTDTIPQVYKIFGPGNQYVTRAKELVQLDGTAIDIPAGPSELLVIADNSANPEFVAADLLSQSEHGTDSQVVLLSDSEKLIGDTTIAIKKQLEKLPRRDIAAKALENSMAILLNDINTCIQLSNLYAPEHLILAISNYKELARSVKSAGSVFLGSYSCESAGDYASGTNHTLPTNGYARAYSGVSLDSYIKKISFQEISREGLKNIGKYIGIMAEAEDLAAHKNAISIRLKSIYDETN